MNRAETVTFGVIAYNEHQYLPDVFEDLLNQTYPKDKIEVILVDGESTDDTVQIMEEFKKKYESEFAQIKILNNPKRVQPAGWNVVINNSSADVLLRIDAHARLAKDFVENNMRCINAGEYVCGGPRENIIDEDTAWKRTLLDAEQSMFGAGIASYRNDTTERKYVSSVFHGAYRREVMEKVGLFNEELIRTEDNEYHYRVREAGYQICYDPSIKSYYQTRNTLRGMLRQKYLNGLWIGKTLFRCPGCISIFHLVPFAFVIAIITTALMAVFGFSWPAVAMWIAYLLANLVMTFTAIIGSKRKNIYMLLLPIIFILLHIGYGVGTMIGIIIR